jgi:predicted dehydrogenase
MAPIRIAIIGLSVNAATNWASAAHLPYLLSSVGKSRYEIVAVCNSTLESAKLAIQAYNLPSGTRAYGSPEDLAADPDVQLVVVSTRVDRHYETALPSVRAGKDVYVEWPLAENTVRARELVELARERGGKTAVGLQVSLYSSSSELLAWILYVPGLI